MIKLKIKKSSDKKRGGGRMWLAIVTHNELCLSLALHFSLCLNISSTSYYLYYLTCS